MVMPAGKHTPITIGGARRKSKFIRSAWKAHWSLSIMRLVLNLGSEERATHTYSTSVDVVALHYDAFAEGPDNSRRDTERLFGGHAVPTELLQPDSRNTYELSYWPSKTPLLIRAVVRCPVLVILAGVLVSAVRTLPCLLVLPLPPWRHGGGRNCGVRSFLPPAAATFTRLCGIATCSCVRLVGRWPACCWFFWATSTRLSAKRSSSILPHP